MHFVDNTRYLRLENHTAVEVWSHRFKDENNIPIIKIRGIINVITLVSSLLVLLFVKQLLQSKRFNILKKE